MTLLPRRGVTSAMAAFALLLASCGSEPSEPVAGVPDEDRALGAEQHPQLLAEFGGAYDGEEARYLAALGERIAGAADLAGQCRFTLVNSDVVNAFAVPGCYIYVTRGLFAIVTSEAELASVLAHEVGHIVAAHSRRQQRRSLWRTLGVIAVSLTGSQILTRIAGEAAQYFTLSYSRAQEYEADDFAIQYLKGVGLDPHASADMLAALSRQEQFMTETSGRDEARSIPEWARSHPLTEKRIERARDAARATGLADDALPENAAGYLREVDGLLYGDDPEQGFVLGRRFAHPVMRIGFEAPPGFTLTNSPQAIQLNGPDGLRGEFGGGPIPAGGLPAYVEQLAGAVVGEMQGSVAGSENRTINGLPAILLVLQVATNAGSMPLSIAVYDGGDGQAYHFIIASEGGNGATPAVTALFNSFQRLTPQEAAQLQPRVIRVVTAAPGETADSLIRRIADPHPRALFLMLNGRTAEAPLRPGEAVKIVVRTAPAGAAR